MNDLSAKEQAALIKAINKGGKGRQEALSRIYSSINLNSAIKHYITQLNAVEAEELTHETFRVFIEKAFKGEQFDPSIPIKPYLLRMARWIHNNQRRKKKPLAWSEDIEPYETADSVERTWIKRELADNLQTVLQTLTEECRHVLGLWQSGFNFKEIADKLGISSETNARKRKHRCYKKLVASIHANPTFKSYLYEN